MEPSRDQQFLTTQWTQILNSQGAKGDGNSAALVTLCQNYHYPVLLFIRNRCGDPEKAKDLCQGFFEFLVETKFYRKADPERGRFRSFLLTAVKNYLLKEHRKASCQKRGAVNIHFSIEDDDLAGPELETNIPADAQFDQQWAITVFKSVWRVLREEYGQLDQLDRFEALRPTIMNPGIAFPYEEVAGQLGMTESGAKSAAFRLKSRFREIFRETVAQLVDHPNEVDAELQYLIEALSFSNR